MIMTIGENIPNAAILRFKVLEAEEAPGERYIHGVFGICPPY
jgi:hypothetical protein